MKGWCREYLGWRLGASVALSSLTLAATTLGQPLPESRDAPSGARAQATSVLLSLEGSWPETLAREVVEDVHASLAERGVVVLTASSGAASDSVRGERAVRGALVIHPPSETLGRFRVVVLDDAGRSIAEREVSLAAEHPDTWSVAIAAAADEQLAAAWRLPPRASHSDSTKEVVDPTPLDAPPSNSAPPEAAKPPEATRNAPTRPPAASAAADAAKERSLGPSFAVGLGAAAERYLPNAWSWGGDVFACMPLGPLLSLEGALQVRTLLARESADGEATGVLAGVSVAVLGPISRAQDVQLDWLFGVGGSQVWFSATPREGAVATHVDGQLVAVRGGAALRVHSRWDTWLGARLTAGVPLIRAEARDSSGPLLRLAGVEAAARLEVGWRL